MKLKKIRWPLFLFAAAFFAQAQADTLIFNNGDRLSGSLVEKTASTIRFRNATLGVVEVPAAQARVEVSQSTAKEPAVATESTPAKTPPGLPEEERKNSLAEEMRQLVNSVIPGNVSGRLDAGLNRTRAESTTTQVAAAGNISVENLPDTYDFKTYYYYTATQNSQGTVSRSADRYGSNFTYNRDLTERWFLNNEDSYLRDFQANINHQAQNSLGAGYSFLKSEQVNLALQAGPSVRYTDATGIEEKWFSLGSTKQTFRWKINDSLRLEQDSALYGDPDQTRNYAWKFKSSLINKVADHLELSVNFHQSYNTIVGLNGARNEQMISLTIGLPF